MRIIILLVLLLSLSGCEIRGYENLKIIKKEFPNNEVYQLDSMDPYNYIMTDSLGSIYYVRVSVDIKPKISSITKIK